MCEITRIATGTRGHAREEPFFHEVDKKKGDELVIIIAQVEGEMAGLPMWMNSLFGSSAVVVAILLNIILSKEGAPVKEMPEK